MKRFISLLLISFIALFQVPAQNYIGLHKDELMKVMNATQRNFKLNTDAVNIKYKYLKYEDKINDQTMLFFLSEDEYCTYMRLMCDYVNLSKVIDSLNKQYIKTSQYAWTYKENGDIYIVDLEKGEWFFTVSIKKK